jgi:hypothetical protein
MTRRKLRHQTFILTTACSKRETNMPTTQRTTLTRPGAVGIVGLGP